MLVACPASIGLHFSLMPIREKEYFDPFGLSLALHTHVYAALESNKLLPLWVAASDVRMLQSTSSTVCGHYCVAFLYWRAKDLRARVDVFARVMSVASGSPERRDMLTVARLLAITSSHPCCAARLLGIQRRRDDRTSPDNTVESQSCCCSAQCSCSI